MMSESTMRGGPLLLSTRMMRQAALGLLLALLPTFLLGAGNEPAIEVVPSSVELLSPESETSVIVIFRNPTSGPLDHIVLTWITNSDWNVTALSPVAGATLAPEAAIAWTLKVAQARQEPVAGSLQLRIDYTTRSDGKTVPHIIAQSVNVKSREFESMDQLVSVDVKTTLASLDTHHRGLIYLVINSKLGRSVKLLITPGGPDFLCFDPKDGCESRSSNGPRFVPTQHEIALAPYETTFDSFVVGASKTVEPGKCLLVFHIAIKPGQQGEPTRSMIKTQEVEVGVFGESAVLKVMGVPSFLLLPGCLLVLTAGLLWETGLLRTKTAGDKFLLEYNKPYFWLVSITFSGLMALAFRAYTGRWYFVRYGLEDIVSVWLVSTVLGGFSFLGLLWVMRWWESLRTPSEVDDHVTILQKLHRQHLKMVRDSYTLKGKEKERPAFLVKKPLEGDSNLWLSPGILLDFAKVTDPKMLSRVRSELNPEGDLGKLADLLKTYKNALRWEAQPIEGVRSVARDQIAAEAGQDNFVQEG